MPSQYRKRLSKKEKEAVQKVAEGGRITVATQEILDRPHVAVALEAILDEIGLDDKSIAKKVKDIIYRAPTESTNPKTGTINTNQTSVDANSLNAIRTVLQVKGKFTDKHSVEHTGYINGLPEEQLDKIIESGSAFLTLGKNRISHTDEPDKPTDSPSRP